MKEKEQKILNFDRDLANFSPRQQDAVNVMDTDKCKFLMYGGALGGGKSYFIRWFAVRYLMKMFRKHGIRYMTVMIACEDYPALKDRQLQKIPREFPEWLGKSYSDHKEYGRCFILSSQYGNGVICFRNLDDASKYASAEFAAIMVDELTKNSYDTFTFLRTRLRWPGLHDMECPFIGGTNPGGIGHGWVKQLWIQKVYPKEFVYPTDYRSAFAFIPSKADDNPYLDASYWTMLNTLPAHLRGAFRDGNWDTFVGQAFQEWTPMYHIIEPVPVPSFAPIYSTFDWGFAKPFSIGWWWIDSEGRIYRFAEWYGWNGTPNEGLRLTDAAIAKGILMRETSMKLSTQRIIHLAGHDCFQKKPDYKGGGQGPSTAEVFRNNGIGLRPTDKDRIVGVRQFRERLRILTPDWDKIARTFELFPEFVSGEVFQWVNAAGDVFSQAELEKMAIEAGVDLTIKPPMMQVYNTCEHFIRTIPDLVHDKNNPEDVDTDGEDHIYDEARQICVARPIGQTKPVVDPIKERLRALEPHQRAVWIELEEMKKNLEEERQMEEMINEY